MYIKTTLNGTTTDDQKIVCEMTSNSVAINFEAIVEPHIKDANTIQWKIIYNGDKTVDENDYTGGKKAEIKIYKEHAGTKEKPATLIVQSYYKGTVFSSVIIKLYATPEIVSAIWSSGGYEATTVQNQQKVGVYIDGKGLSGQTLNVNIFDKEDPETIIDSKSILKTQSEAFTEWVARNSSEEDKTFFLTVNHKETELYRSKDLMVVAHTKRRELPEIPVNLTPVTVYTEEYFTQKYEPCKYTKIEVTIGTEAPVTIFDETKPQAKINRDIFNKIIKGKSTKKLSEKITITLDSVTDECRNPEQDRESHGGSVFTFNKDRLNAKEVTPDKKLEILSLYNYEYLDDDLKFFLKYFIFSALIPENILKGVLIKAEIDWKDYPQEHKIKIDTCRYNDKITLKIMPDVAWAFHFDYGNLNPENQLYYKDIKTIKKVKGLKEEIEIVQATVKRFEKFTSFGPTGAFTNGIKDMVFEIIKGMSLELTVGFQSYYDFDNNNNNNNTPLTIRDYTKDHPWIGKVYIAGVLTLIIAIEVLLCVITEGASAARYLAKINKVRKLSGKWAKLAEKGEKISRGKMMGLKGMGTALDYVKGLNFSYYKAYQFIATENNEVGLLIEECFKFSLIDFKKRIKNLSFGEIAYNMTPVGLAINLTQITLDTAIGLQGSMNLFKAAKGYAKGNKGKGVKAKVKAGAKAYGDRKEHDYLTYPLQLLQKGILVAELYLIETTNKFLKNVLETDGEFNAEFGGSIDLEYHVKANNVSKTFELASLVKGVLLQNKDEGKEISIAPSGNLSIFITMTAKTNVHVRAMDILNYDDSSCLKSIESGTFTLQGGLKLERRFFFKPDKKPYYQDSYVFKGIAGEYTLVKKVKSIDKKSKKDKKPKKDKSFTKKFILMQPDSFVSEPEPIF